MCRSLHIAIYELVLVSNTWRGNQLIYQLHGRSCNKDKSVFFPQIRVVEILACDQHLGVYREGCHLQPAFLISLFFFFLLLFCFYVLLYYCERKPKSEKWGNLATYIEFQCHIKICSAMINPQSLLASNTMTNVHPLHVMLC